MPLTPLPGLESFSLAALLWITLVMALAGLVHGTLGLGFPLVATPLIAIVTDIKTAIVLVLLPCIAVVAVSILKGGELRSVLRVYWPMPVCAFIGSTIGTHIYLAVDAAPFTLALAIVILVYLNLERLGKTNWPMLRKHRFAFGALFGLISGLCDSTVNVAAPPLIIYFMNLGLQPVIMVKALNICFASGKVTQLANLLYAGNMAVATWLATLPFAGLSIATLLGGMAIRDLIDAATYRAWLKKALFVMALVLVAQFVWQL